MIDRSALRFATLVGKSPAMQRLLSLLERIADSDSSVLIEGENGTGKELIARALHFKGRRKGGPWIAQNCSALNDNLLESELFGHARGAFTGATRDRQGLFKVAHQGTLFLDEVGDMSPAMQVKLLRVLQEGTFVPVGGTRPEVVDVRIIAATNRGLKKLVEQRLFREDLYYRLNVIQVEVPPLRERLDDLPLLVDCFLGKHAERSGKPKKELSPELRASFQQYAWPGNIRELENEVERLVVLAGDQRKIGPDLFARSRQSSPEPRSFSRFRERGGLAEAVAALEREMIAQGLIEACWNKTQVAQRLGLSRTTLIKKIREYGIEIPEVEG